MKIGLNLYGPCSKQAMKEEDLLIAVRALEIDFVEPCVLMGGLTHNNPSFWTMSKFQHLYKFMNNIGLEVKSIHVVTDSIQDSVDEMIDLSNLYAPEHLIMQVKDYEQLAERVINAGSVFLGPYACESAGDYASGTNHTLPTHGYATAYNGVNLDSYCRKITFQHLTEEGIRHIGRAVELMAEAEQLDAHKNAMSVRIRSISNESLVMSNYD